MQVSVEVTQAAAQALRAATNRSISRSKHELPQRLGKLGIQLMPMHSGTDDPELAVHFYASAASETEAAKMVKLLLELPEVQAAYVKPPDGPPA